MTIIFFIILISVNSLSGACVEESHGKQAPNEKSDKTESLSEDITQLERKDDFEDYEELGKMSINERVLDEILDEEKADKIEEKSVKEISPIPLQDESKTASQNSEKQFEELPEILHTNFEERIGEDLSEASAESKISDNENASPKLVESDRRFDSENAEIEEKTDELSSHEILATRRMLSNHDVVLDTKGRSDSLSDDLVPEGKAALRPTPNTYNNFNEFDTKSRDNLRNFKPKPRQKSVKTLIFTPSMTSPPPLIRVIPSQENLVNQNTPQFYTQPELNLKLPEFHPIFHGTQDVPIYLELKQIQPKDYSEADKNYQTPAYEKEGLLEPSNQQKFRQPQSIDDTNRNLENTGNNYNFSYEPRRPAQEFYPLDTKTLPEQTPFEFLSYSPGNQQIFENQNQIQNVYKNQGLNFPTTVEPKMQAHPLLQTNEIIDFDQFFKIKPYDSLSFESATRPYSYTQGSFSIPKLNGNIPFRNNFDSNSQNVKTLFNKLTQATNYPKISSTLNSAQLMQPNPYIFPYPANPYSYGLNYISNFQKIP